MTYTLRNPEEANIVRCWTEYPHCGSLVFPREELIAMVPPGLPLPERHAAARFQGRDR